MGLHDNSNVFGKEKKSEKAIFEYGALKCLKHRTDLSRLFYSNDHFTRNSKMKKNYSRLFVLEAQRTPTKQPNS
jgi:hypothetical protein